MNRSALNSVPLGSGNPNAWVSAAISQALVLAGVVTPTVLKYARASQSLALDGALHVMRRVSGAVASVLTLAGSVAPDKHHVVRSGPINGTLGLDALFRALRITRATLTQGLDLSGSLTVRTYRLVRVSVGQLMLLSGSLAAYDLSRTPASDERTAKVPESAREARVSSEHNSIGVS